MEDQLLVIADDVVVSLDYVLTVDGEVVDSTEGHMPLEYMHGHRNLIPGLERELAGMKVNETKEVLVKAVDAYGEYSPASYVTFNRAQFPEGFAIEIGAEIYVRGGNGQAMPARIAEVDGDDVRLDLNHPLAGKDLHFTATVVAMRPATEQELIAGRVGGGCSSCGSGGCSSGCDSGCC